MLTVGGLFSGIGGFEIGFQRAGMEIKWMVEIDEFCNKILAKHWPDVTRYKDVRECGKHNLEPVDVICGGVPCQPASVAGKRRGEKDDRWLWSETFKIVRDLRPTWCVFENVPGLLSLEQGHVFDTLLSQLESEDYACWTLNIPACAFNAPHRRERVFIIANTESYLWGTSWHDRSKSFDGSDSFMADAEKLSRDDKRDNGPGKEECGEIRIQGATGGSSDVSHARSDRRGQMEQPIIERTPKEKSTSEIADSGITRRGAWWAVESQLGGTTDGFPRKLDGYWREGWERDIPRVARGVPDRVQRLKALGNAVVPVVAQFIAERIIECHLANTQEQD